MSTHVPFGTKLWSNPIIYNANASKGATPFIRRAGVDVQGVDVRAMGKQV